MSVFTSSTVWWRLAAVLLFGCLFFSIAQAQTVVTGTVNDQVWGPGGSPYIINQRVYVDSLTILPGTEIELNGSGSLWFSGPLQAIGSPTDSIRFYAGANGSGGSLHFRASASGTLQYASVTGLDERINSAHSSIHQFGAVELSDLSVRDCYIFGINADNRNDNASLSMRNITVRDAQTGIRVIGGEYILENVDVSGGFTGIKCGTDGRITVNTANLKGHSQEGINLDPGAEIIANDVSVSNSQYGISGWGIVTSGPTLFNPGGFIFSGNEFNYNVDVNTLDQVTDVMNENIRLRGGSVTDDRTIPVPGAGSRYFVGEGIYVRPTGNLTIAAGVTLNFVNNASSPELLVDGSLTAEGTITDSIRFRGVRPDLEVIEGLSATAGRVTIGRSSAGSTLRYCTFSKVGMQGRTLVIRNPSTELAHVSIDSISGIGIDIVTLPGEAVHLEEITIRDVQDGISVGTNSEVVLENANIRNCSFNGLNLNSESTTQATNVMIDGCGRGIYWTNDVAGLSNFDNVQLRNNRTGLQLDRQINSSFAGLQIDSTNVRQVVASAASVTDVSALTGVEIEIHKSPFARGNVLISLPGAGSHYVIATDFGMHPLDTLTIAPGVSLQLRNDATVAIGGGLVAEGTSAQPITFFGDPDVPDHVMQGDVYINTSVGQAQLSHVHFIDLGWSGSGNEPLYISTTSITASHLRFERCHYAALVFRDGGGTFNDLLFKDCTGASSVIRMGNGDDPFLGDVTIENCHAGIRMYEGCQPSFGDFSFVNTPINVYAEPGVANIAGTIDSVAIYLFDGGSGQPGGNDWQINSLSPGSSLNLHTRYILRAPDKLTIGAGTTFNFHGPEAKFQVQGQLVAAGTEQDSVYFRRVAGPDPSVPAHNSIMEFWHDFDSRLEYAVVDGNHLPAFPNVGIVKIERDGRLSIENSTFRSASTLGLSASGSVSVNLSIQNTRFEYCGGTALDILNGPNYNFANLHFADNGRDVQASPELLDQLSGFHNANVYTTGYLYGNSTLESPGPGSSYVVEGELYIVAGDTLTLSPGANVKFSALQNSSLRISGRLAATGTDDDPIKFSGIPNEEGLGQGRVYVDGSGASVALDQVRFEDMGIANNPQSALYFRGQTANITNTTFEDCPRSILYDGRYTAAQLRSVATVSTDTATNETISNCEFRGGEIAIEVQGRVPTIDSCNFRGQTNLAIRNQGIDTIRATSCYWDDMSGPFHTELNAMGQGIPVSDRVLFDPWLEEPLVITGGRIALAIRTVLEGAYDPATDLMRNDLAQAGHLPLTEPYGTGNDETTTAAVLADQSVPENAIVDWVLVQLRSATDTEVATRAALIQRDGDVVDVDGASPVHFPEVAAGSYYVVLTHRNHLSIMTRERVELVLIADN